MFYENVGTKAKPEMHQRELQTPQLWSITLGAPRLADLDADGDLDLAICVRPNMYLLLNNGTRKSPDFSGAPVSILPQWGPAPMYADQLLDWNRDGRIDLVHGFNVRNHILQSFRFSKTRRRQPHSRETMSGSGAFSRSSGAHPLFRSYRLGGTPPSRIRRSQSLRIRRRNTDHLADAEAVA